MNAIIGLTKDAAGFASLVGVVALLLATTASILIFYQQRIQAKRSDDHNNAMLNLIRSSYEDKIADMNQRLMATEERWKDVNHLIIDSQKGHPVSAPHIRDSQVSVERFLQPFGIGAAEFQIDPRLVFVLTPFTQRERSTYAAIKETVSRLSFRCVKSDDEYLSGEILPSVVRHIVQCRFVIANISGRNPNVYYELGLAHALGKPTILVARTLESVPFNLQSRYIVLFDDNAELQDRLRDAITQILADPAAN